MGIFILRARRLRVRKNSSGRWKKKGRYDSIAERAKGTMNENCTDKIDILRFRHGGLEHMEDTVLAEQSFTLFLNGNLFTTFSCINKDVRELAAGRLFCEGLVQLKEALRSVSIDNKGSAVFAETTGVNASNNCSENRKPVTVDYAAVVSALREFQDMSALFRETGSVHSAALLDNEYCFRYFSEDLSRYNAVEKVIGKAFLDGFPLHDAKLVTSSRMPLELIQKIYRSGINVVISISAPTLQSIRFARENKVILIGMFRDNRINIYSHGQ